MSTEERRAAGATRFPFDALVEVGGALGPTFEAQAVNVSEDGIQLRTAYLPEPGQPLTCRFDAGPSQNVLAAGEVVWAHGVDSGGEFGVRFTELDAESVDALKKVCGLGGGLPAAQPGSKVRLHIDGLASPMRAKIKNAQVSEVTVGSDLGFLQVGRQLELEDAKSGSKRPASIDRVEVAMDPTSNVPQLVVTLRYGDVEDASRASMPAPSHRPSAPRVASASPNALNTADTIEQASFKMKGFVARKLAEVGPFVSSAADRTKTMFTLLMKRGSERAKEVATVAASRRTTAPAPGGGLHAEGRRVVRGEPSAPILAEGAALSSRAFTKRRAALAGGVMVAAILGALALKKAHHDPAADAKVAEVPSAAVPAAPPSPPPAPPTPEPASAAPLAASGPSVGESDDGAQSHAHKKRIHVTPFGNGPVHHANVLRLKMDGLVESIEGAQLPTGFTVKVPGRKTAEPAAPLSARDGRIASIKADNGGAGAEISVSFKDGVPNYRVSARGDTLVIALAPPGAVEQTVANKDESGARSAKHGKHAPHEKMKGGDQSL